ncbi:MAG: SMC-Scp complex subunit ScpB, partial [Rhodospirillales bacterium]
MVEAILFASAEPLSERSLQARLPDGAEIKELLTTLQAQYAGRGVNLVQAGATWALRTAEDMGPLLTRQAEVVRKLSRAAVEMLAIIAYHQPVTRGEMEEIRGVTISKGTLDTLLEAGWIRPRGRRRTPGRPVTWGTTNS